MAYRLSVDDVIAEPSDRAGWHRVRLPDDVGACFVDRMQVMDGITLAYTDYLPLQDIVEESRMDRDRPVLAITVGLDGCSGYMGEDDNRFRFDAGFSTVTSFSRMNGERRYRGQERVRQLRLLIDEAALGRHALDGLLAGRAGLPAQLLHHGKCPPALAAFVRTLENRHQLGDVSLIELQIAALSLLAGNARDLSALCPPPVTASASWSPADRRKLHQARDLLHEHYARPLTISDLCQMAGINEFKLKQGFRDLFDTTPHRMLTEIRMTHAHAALLRGEPVSTVAYRSGYQHPANFSAAFSRFHGISPSAVRRGLA